MDGGGHRSRSEEVTTDAARRICQTIRIPASYQRDVARAAFAGLAAGTARVATHR